MVASAEVGSVEVSFVRITDKTSGEFIQTDITQNLQNENNPNSPLNEEIGNLVVNQERRLLAAMESKAQSVRSKEAETIESEETKKMVTPPRAGTVRDQLQLIQRLSPSERSLAAQRMRSKMPLMQRPPVFVSSEEQQKVILRRLEEEVDDLKKNNYDLKKKVTMFQDLLRNREKLDKVLKKLDGKE